MTRSLRNIPRSAGTTGSLLAAFVLAAGPAAATATLDPNTISACTYDGVTTKSFTINYGDTPVTVVGVSSGAGAGNRAWYEAYAGASLEYAGAVTFFPGLTYGWNPDLAGTAEVSNFYALAATEDDPPVYSASGPVLCSVTVTHGPVPPPDAVNYGHSDKTANTTDRARKAFTSDPPAGRKPKKERERLRP